MKKRILFYILFILLTLTSTAFSGGVKIICPGGSSTSNACTGNQVNDDTTWTTDQYGLVVFKWVATCSGIPDAITAYTKYYDCAGDDALKYVVWANSGSAPTGTPLYAGAMSCTGGTTTYTWNITDTNINLNFQEGTTYWLGICPQTTAEGRVMMNNAGTGVVKYINSNACYSDLANYSWPGGETTDTSADLSIRLEY